MIIHNIIGGCLSDRNESDFSRKEDPTARDMEQAEACANSTHSTINKLKRKRDAVDTEVADLDDEDHAPGDLALSRKRIRYLEVSLSTRSVASSQI
jgi:hypothetical protein